MLLSEPVFMADPGNELIWPHQHPVCLVAVCLRPFAFLAHCQWQALAAGCIHDHLHIFGAGIKSQQGELLAQNFKNVVA
jgi:hypothetical protein